MRFKKNRQDEVEINLMPLIDVVFLLLIFFMVTTTFTRETRLVVELPEAQGAEQVIEKRMVEVSIAATGEMVVNGNKLVKVDRDTLRAVLMPLAQEGTNIPFIISADRNATHQAVVLVMDVAGQLGFVNLSISTQEFANE